MTREQLEASFLPRGELRGGILMLRADDARALVAAAKQHNMPVLGIDAFALTTHTTQPAMEHSVDFDTEVEGSSVDCWSAATDFLSRLRTRDLHFEVVLGRA